MYLIKALENTQIWHQFAARILVWNFRQESCPKSIKNTIETHMQTHTHTHTHSRIDTQQKKLPAAEAIKKAHI